MTGAKRVIVAAMNEPKRPEFVHFNRLPPEIRIMIWNLAIQNYDAEPAAHFFSVAETEKVMSMVESDGLGWRDWVEEKTHLCQPLINSATDDDKVPCPVEQNISGYCWDSGLWHACAESCRAIARRRFERDKRTNPERFRWHSTSVVSLKLGPLKSPEPCITMHFPQDLLVLQLPDSMAFQSFARIAQFDFSAARIPALRIRHCGLEYNPQWARDGRSSSWYGLPVAGIVWEAQALNKAGIEFLWLLDTTSYRSIDGIGYNQVKEKVAGRHQSVAQGGRYIEYYWGDLDVIWQLAEVEGEDEYETMQNTPETFAGFLTSEVFPHGTDSCPDNVSDLGLGLHGDMSISTLVWLPEDGYVGKPE